MKQFSFNRTAGVAFGIAGMVLVALALPMAATAAMQGDPKSKCAQF